MPVERLRNEITRVLTEMGIEPGEISFERPRNPDHGDFSSNVALTLAKPLGRPPRELATELVERLDLSGAGIRAAEIAGPGFINFRLASDYIRDGLLRIVGEGDAYGRSDVGESRPAMVEFVSANPTGALHIGHGRQAALGDAVSELLAWTGWKVHREFYYNDAGEQIARLTRSVWTRYLQQRGVDIPFPEDGYHGTYISEIAAEIASSHGDRIGTEESEEALDLIRQFAVQVLRGE